MTHCKLPGVWCVDAHEINVCINTEVSLEITRSEIEDACWLHPANDAQYINLVELDAVLKSINLALQ